MQVLPIFFLFVSIYSRYIPDTYPIHTRYIRISHEYPTNTPRMLREYPKHEKKEGKKCTIPAFTPYALHLTLEKSH